MSLLVCNPCTQPQSRTLFHRLIAPPPPAARALDSFVCSLIQCLATKRRQKKSARCCVTIILILSTAQPLVIEEPLMKKIRWTPAWLTVIALLLIGIGVTAWLLRPVEYLASGSQTSSFEIDCSFDRFRQIMVRKNATAAIIAHSGMTLLDEKVAGLQVDARGDDRPLLNALRGRSKTNVSATREITVKLEDPAIHADQLVLRQLADIQPETFHVVTQSKAPAGNLESYKTTLMAVPSGNSTQVDLLVALQVHIRLPKLFGSRADAGVQQAADRAVIEQVAAISAFVDQYAGDLLIIPQLK